MKNIAFLAAALAFAPAVAQAAEPAPTYTVRHDDLDLGTTKGIAELDARIEYAARALCSSSSRDMQSLRDEEKCRRDVIETHRQAVRLAIATAKPAHSGA